jgi:hypothetical protein
MAGFEPASERFDPRIYYERIWLSGIAPAGTTSEIQKGLSAQARKPSFTWFTDHQMALRLCDALSRDRQEFGVSGRDLT